MLSGIFYLVGVFLFFFFELHALRDTLLVICALPAAAGTIMGLFMVLSGPKTIASFDKTIAVGVVEKGIMGATRYRPDGSFAIAFITATNDRVYCDDVASSRGGEISVGDVGVLFTNGKSFQAFWRSKSFSV